MADKNQQDEIAEKEAETSLSSSMPGAPPLHVLVDTNVILDLLLTRDPWYTQAQPMWDARDAGRLFVYVPASTLTDVFYICRKQVGADGAKQAVEVCLRGFTVLMVDRAILEQALLLAGSDFEDNAQIACAQVAGLDMIVTRDSSDFGHSPIPAAGPLDVIARLIP